MKKSLLPVFFFYFIFFVPTYSQSSPLDSLFQELEITKEDSSKVDLFYAIGKKYYDILELDSAFIYVEKAVQLADFKQLDYRKIKAIYLKGLIFLDQGEFSLALTHLLKAKKWYEESQIDYDRFHMHLFLGYMFEEEGNIQKAVSHYDSAEIFMANGDINEAYELNLNLADLYWRQKKYEDAKKRYIENIELARLMEDSLQLYYSYTDLGALYNDLHKPDSGVYYLEMGIPVIKNHDPQRAACLQGCLGTNYKSLGNYKLALINFEESINNFKGPDKSFECSSFADMATCYLHLGEMEKANYYNDLAISLLEQATNQKLKRDAFKEIIALYKTQGDYERALLNIENLKILEDKLFQRENNEAIEELQVKYQTREQQTQMELQSLKLNRQSILIVLASILLFLLITVLFLVWRNVRYRKRANKLLSERNEQLEELDQKKSRFFSNISHELRTPLTLIGAPLEKILDKVENREIKENLHLAHRNSQKLLVLVDEILDLSKLESGQMQLHLVPIQLEEVLRRIFFAFQSLADIRRLKLEFISQLPKDLWVKADLPKLEKMFNNLVSNAIKYSDPGGKVTLNISLDKTAALGEKFVIQVSDTGKGIHEEDITKIFDRFYQSNSGPLVGGTGIGLALTKELVTLFGGNIDVNSRLGKGSTFTIVLPLTLIDKPIGLEDSIGEEDLSKNVAKERLSSKTISKGYTPVLLGGRKPRILLVEDNPEMSRFLHQTLAPSYECTMAYDGKEALQRLEREKFDLVTSDVMMPQMDGFELLEKVRRESTVYKNIPFILLTARSLETDKLEGFQLGVDDYITKPFSVKELIARIQNLLKNKQGRAEWEKGETVDKKILKVAEQFVLDHISDTSFGVHQLSTHLTMSQRSLERLIKRLSGLSPVGFIREIRLQKAYQLLKRRQYLTVTDVRFAVGMENASYFNRKFKERFGINPKELLGPVLKESFS